MSTPILGQATALRTLTRAMGTGRMHHAWIFHGPAGTGKFTAAMHLARLLLDPSVTQDRRAAFDPPDAAESEVASLIDAGTHPDLHVIRKEHAARSAQRELRDRKQTNIPLDLLRELMIGGGDFGGANAPPVFRTPLLGHGKVFIIDEADLLETEAQNAMLKTLEEPPERTWIILCVEQEERLLPTIRSRCQRIPFGPLPADAMQRWWQSSGLEVEPAERAWVDRFAAGSPGMARRAVEERLIDSWRELQPSLEAIERGRFDAALAGRMAEFVDGYAKSVVKQNENASKEAANRAGARLLAALLGAHVRERISERISERIMARADTPGDGVEPWLELVDALRGFDEALRANINMKHAIADLVAQWMLHAAGAKA